MLSFSRFIALLFHFRVVPCVLISFRCVDYRFVEVGRLPVAIDPPSVAFDHIYVACPADADSALSLGGF